MRRALAVLTIAATALGVVAVAAAGAGGSDIEPRISKAEVRRLPFLGELEPVAVAPSAFAGVPSSSVDGASAVSSGTRRPGRRAPAQATPTPEERLRNSVTATEAAGTASFEGDVELEDGEVPVTFSGAVALDGQDGEVALTFGGDAPIDAMSTRVVGGTYFVELAPLADVVLGGLLDDLPASIRSKDWVRVEPRQLIEVGVGAAGSDPAAQFAMLRAMQDVEEVGAEDVEGESTTHFRGVANLRRAIRLTPRAERPRLRASFDTFEGNEVPVDVWLDASDRLRRIDLAVEVEDEGEGTVSATYSDFGVPVEAEAPPRNTVVGFDAFLDAVREAAASGGP